MMAGETDITQAQTRSRARLRRRRGMLMQMALISSTRNPSSGVSDTTPPSLSSPTDTATGQTTADLAVTTNENNGTLYTVITTSATPPTATQVRNGQDSNGVAATYAANQSISSTGAKTFSATGLTASTSYTAHFMHEDLAGNKSAVVSGNGLTTSSAYTGPGDIASGAYHWWGLRGYTAAYAAPGNNPAIDVVDTATGLIATTINITSSGNLDVATILGLGYGVSVKKLYDQTGNGKHATQATLANMPVLTQNVIGSLPGITFTGASAHTMDSGAAAIDEPAPVSMSLVGKRTSGTTFSGYMCNTAGNTGILAGNAANQTALFAGNVTEVTATDNTFHAFNALINGASSKYSVDGTSANQDAGTQTWATSTIRLGKFISSAFTGIICEGGSWASDKSANFAAIDSNQRAYWGF